MIEKHKEENGEEYLHRMIMGKKLPITVLTKEERAQMVMDANRLIESEWMKKYPVGDYGDYKRRFESILEG